MDLYWILGGWGCGVINAEKCGCSCCCWGGGVCFTLPITFYGSTPRPLGLPSIVWMNGQLCPSQAVFSKLLKRRGSTAEGRIDTSCLCIQLTLWQFSMLVINWVVQMFLSCESCIFAHMQSFVQQVLWVVTSTLFGGFVSLWGSVTTPDVCQLVVTWNWIIPDPSECYSSRTNAFKLLVWLLALRATETQTKMILWVLFRMLWVVIYLLSYRPIRQNILYTCVMLCWSTFRCQNSPEPSRHGLHWTPEGASLTCPGSPLFLPWIAYW